MGTSKFQSSYSLPTFPPWGPFCEADGQFECGESLLRSLSLSPVNAPPTTHTHTRAPPILPLSASPAVQQQWGRWGWGPASSGGVPWPDLPGVTVALPPAGCTGLHLRCAAAAVSGQLGRACEVRSSDKAMHWESYSHQKEWNHLWFIIWTL